MYRESGGHAQCNKNIFTQHRVGIHHISYFGHEAGRPTDALHVESEAEAPLTDKRVRLGDV